MFLRNPGVDDGKGGGPDAESASACIGLPTSLLVVCLWRSRLVDKLEHALIVAVVDTTPLETFLLPTP